MVQKTRLIQFAIDALLVTGVIVSMASRRHLLDAGINSFKSDWQKLSMNRRSLRREIRAQ